MSASDQLAAPLASTMRLPALPRGWQTVEFAVLRDGSLAVLVTDVDLAGEHRRIQAALEASSSPNPPSQLTALSAAGTARILVASPSGWTDELTFPLETPWPLFDRFTDGRWLVVAARSLDTNARVLSRDGALLNRLWLGDGIQHVATDDSDRIWVGWFDEGMFGNEGWQVPGRERPPSNNGVACFDSNGELVLVPDWPSAAGMIADCYALNVIGSGAWVCPYTEFPLVRFSTDEATRWWRNSLPGPKAIAIDGFHALVAGGYREEANRLALVALEGDGQGEDVSPLADWSLPLRRVERRMYEWAPVWTRPDLLSGRGDMLHLVSDETWYRWRIGDLIHGR